MGLLPTLLYCISTLLYCISNLYLRFLLPTYCTLISAYCTPILYSLSTVCQLSTVNCQLSTVNCLCQCQQSNSSLAIILSPGSSSPWCNTSLTFEKKKHLNNFHHYLFSNKTKMLRSKTETLSLSATETPSLLVNTFFYLYRQSVQDSPAEALQLTNNKHISNNKTNSTILQTANTDVHSISLFPNNKNIVTVYTYAI